MIFSKGIRLNVLLWIFLLSVLVSVQPAQASNDVVAKVGKISITQYDLNRELNRLIPMNTSFHGGVKPETLEQMKQEALQNLIDRAYKVQYAIDEEIAVDQKKLESNWQTFKQKNAKALASAPEETLAKLRADQYLDLLAAKAEEEAVDNKINIDEEMVKKYYEENKDHFLKPKTFTASHIMVRVDPSSPKEEKDQKKQRADELYQRAISGENFYNLAYYESDDRTKYVGGSLGSFHAGQTVAEFDQAIQEMKAGDISEPIKTIYGYHIIRLDNVEDERQLSFDEAAVSIREKMRSDQREQLYSSWMENLKKKYLINLYEPS